MVRTTFLAAILSFSLLAVLLGVEAQFTVSFSPAFDSQFTVGTSHHYTVSVDVNYPNISLRAPASTDSFSVSPELLTFSPGQTSHVLTFTAKSKPGMVLVAWTLEGDNAIYYTAPAYYTYVAMRYLSFDGGYAPYTSPYRDPVVGVPTDSFALSLSLPPPVSVSVNVRSDPVGVIFYPDTFSFTAANEKYPFYFKSNVDGAFTIEFVISGRDAELFEGGSHSITVSKRSIVPASSYTSISPVVVNAESQTIRLSVNYPPPNGITLTPHAENVTFSPSELKFSPGVDSAQFVFKSSSTGSHLLSWTLGGTDSNWYNNLPNKTINISPKTFKVSYPNKQNYCLGQTSEPITISTQYPPEIGVTLNITVSAWCSSGMVSFPSQYLAFTPTVLEKSFTLSTHDECSDFTYEVKTSGMDRDNYGAPAISTPSLYFQKLELAITPLDPNYSGGLYCGDSNKFALSISAPPASAFTVTLSAPGATFSDTSFEFSSSVLTHSFAVTSTYLQGSLNVHTQVTGDGSKLVALAGDYSIDVDPKSITAPIASKFRTAQASSTFYAGTKSVPIYIELSHPPASDVSVSVQATGLTFSPSTITFSSKDKSLFFTATAQDAGTYTVYYTLSGADAGCYSLSSTSVSVSVSKLSIQVSPSWGELPVGKESQLYTVSVDNLEFSLTLTPKVIDAYGLEVTTIKFNPSQITLSKAQPSAAFTYVASEYRFGSDSFLFVIGDEFAFKVNSYTTSPPITSLRTFKLPARLVSYDNGPFRAATFVPGIPSPSLVVKVEDPPISSVTLRPTAPNTVFDPEELTFDSSATSRSFTLTTLDGLAGGGNPKTITWTVGGTDAALFEAPGSSSFIAKKRSLSVALADYLLGSEIYVNTQVPFAITTPYPPSSPLTIYPSGSSFSFDPSSVVIDSSNPSAVLKVTPKVVGSNLRIKFTVEGENAEWYEDVADVYVYTKKPAFQLSLPAGLGDFQLLYGVPSMPITIRALAPPTTDVTLSLYSQQVEVSPKTLVFTPADMVQTVTVTLVPSAFMVGNTNIGIVIESVVGGTNMEWFDAPSDFQFNAYVLDPARTLKFYPQQIYDVAQGRDVTFTVTSDQPPLSEVVLTPVIPTDSSYVISPSSVKLTTAVTSAKFTVKTDSYVVDAATIFFVASGADADLYAHNTAGVTLYPASPSISVVNLPSSFIAGKTINAEIRLSEAPAGTLVVEPYVVFGQPVTFNPAQVNFKQGETAAPFSLVGTAVGTTRIGFRVGGESGEHFSAPPVVIRSIIAGTITFDRSLSFSHGGTSIKVTVSLNAPATNGLTITPQSPGVVFDPAEISIAAGVAFASFKATATANSLNDYMFVSLGGPDGEAGLYNIPCALQSCYVSSGAGTVSVTRSGIQDLKNTITFSISGKLELPLTITPQADGVTFIPNSVTVVGSTSSVQVTAIGKTEANVNVYATLSGEAAPFFTMQDLYQSPVVLQFNPYDIMVTSPAAQPIIGAPSEPFIVSLAITPFLPLRSVQVFPVASIPGVVFSPTNVTLDASTNASSALTGSFTYVTNFTGVFFISYKVVGDDAAAFLVPAPTQITPQLASFGIPSMTNTFVDSGSIFIYGVRSPAYTITVRSVPAAVSLELQSEFFEFSPSVLHFSPSKHQATFSFVPKKIGLAVISFSVIGELAHLFIRPAPVQNLRVTYKVNLPKVMNLKVGEVADHTVSIEPVPQTAFILNLQSSNAWVVFSPSTLIFSPAETSLRFSTLAMATSTSKPGVAVHIPGASTNIGSSMSVVLLSGRDGIESSDHTVLLAKPVGIIVTPGTFTLKHPRYQLDVKSKIKVEISALPRSDVVLTLFGNNLLFEPQYLIFVAGGAKEQEIEVTPLHTTSYELDYASFKVDYSLSGTNAQDYIVPSESNHYFAIPRGYIAAIVLVPIAIVVIIVVVIFLLARRAKSSGGGGTSIQVRA